MPKEKGGYVYILSSKTRRLYAGVTSQLSIRLSQHKAKTNPSSFTARYNIDQLVYFEAFASIDEAIARETRIKNMTRHEKIQLIVSLNHTWRDLSADWGKPVPPFDESKMRPPASFGQTTNPIAEPPEACGPSPFKRPSMVVPNS